ncbi:MAG TPA: hypothetical protein ENI61_04865, partial [Ignavibacteria bacterium]|nr:hypothetical protein [Ignavibacteria bacterium]
MKRQKALILFFSILFILVLIGVYAKIFTNQNKLISKDNYYENFGESCFDRVTDDYLMGVCEKIKDSAEKDTCYYNKGISSGYDRVCHLIGNK